MVEPSERESVASGGISVESTWYIIFYWSLIFFLFFVGIRTIFIRFLFRNKIVKLKKTL